MEHALPRTEMSATDALRAEISRVEKHLADIVTDDDSAYAKARIRLYEALLVERRRQLDTWTALQQSSSHSHDYL